MYVIHCNYDYLVSVNARLNVNVALNRPSYQSSTWRANYARYANDGNNDTRVYDGPCMHTLHEWYPWWAVDLGVALYVAGVKFTSRSDCNCGTYAILVYSIGGARRGPEGPGPSGEWKKFHNRFSCETGTNIYMKSYV